MNYEFDIKEEVSKFDENRDKNLEEFDEKINENNENKNNEIQRELDNELKRIEEIEIEQKKPPIILNLEYKLDKLINLQKFDEAHEIQLKLDELAKVYKEKNDSYVKKKMENYYEKLKSEKKLLIDNLKQKNLSERILLKNKFDKDKVLILNQLKAKYNLLISKLKKDLNNSRLLLNNFKPIEPSFKKKWNAIIKENKYLE